MDVDWRLKCTLFSPASAVFLGFSTFFFFNSTFRGKKKLAERSRDGLGRASRVDANASCVHFNVKERRGCQRLPTIERRGRREDGRLEELIDELVGGCEGSSEGLFNVSLSLYIFKNVLLQVETRVA